MWKSKSSWLTSDSWLMLPEISLLTGLTKERIWQNYLFPGPGVGAASMPSHFMNCLLGVPDKWTGKMWIFFLVERTQNSKTMSMYMPSDCAQACTGTLKCLFAHIQKSLTCFSLQFLRKELQPSCVAEQVCQVRVLTYYTRLAGYNTLCHSWANQVGFFQSGCLQGEAID